jgi:thiosulfate reductase/polysulfide reductase chain A
MAVEQRLKGAASWFYWIAALSLINSIIVMAGGNWHFIIGMGVTTVVREATITGKPYPIKGWFAMGTNVLRAMPNEEETMAAINPGSSRYHEVPFQSAAVSGVILPHRIWAV